LIFWFTNNKQCPDAGGLGYYAQLLSLSYISGLKAKGYYQLAAGYGTIGYEPEVNTFFGQPRGISTGGVAFDIPMIHITANQDGDAEKMRQFNLQIGTLSSALEHITPEQMFAPTDPNAPKPDAISAVKALQKASQAGQKIYSITKENINEVLPFLKHDSESISEITRAVSAGKDVTTHTDKVSIPGGWSGFGYIITDPVLGDGVYKISGGKNGGEIGNVDEGSGLLSLIGTMVDVVDWIFSKTNIDTSRIGQVGQTISIASSILSSVSISQKCSKDIARVLILFSTFLTLLSMAPFLLLGILLNPIGAILFSLALSVGFGFGTQYLQDALCKAR